MTIDTLLAQTILNGVLIGGIFVVASVGLSLVFGVMRLINFAQGDFVILGAYSAYWIASLLAIDALYMFPLVFSVFFMLGYCLQKRVVKHVIAGPELVSLILFFGLSIIIYSSTLYAWGPFARHASAALSGVSVSIGGLSIPILRGLTFVLALVSICGLFVFLRKTKIGLGIVATSQNRDLARTVGVDIENIFAITMGIGVGTAGMAGALISTILSFNSMTGPLYTLFAFFIVVLGGMGYLPGTLFGGLLLGIIQSFVVTYQSVQLVYLILFLILYFMMLLRPKGLFGRGI